MIELKNLLGSLTDEGLLVIDPVTNQGSYVTKETLAAALSGVTLQEYNAFRAAITDAPSGLTALGFTNPILDRTAPGDIGASTPAEVNLTNAIFTGMALNVVIPPTNGGYTNAIGHEKDSFIRADILDAVASVAVSPYSAPANAKNVFDMSTSTWTVPAGEVAAIEVTLASTSQRNNFKGMMLLWSVGNTYAQGVKLEYDVGAGYVTQFDIPDISAYTKGGLYTYFPSNLFTTGGTNISKYKLTVTAQAGVDAKLRQWLAYPINQDEHGRYLLWRDGRKEMYGPLTFKVGAATAIGTSDAYAFYFKTSGSNRFGIDTSGNLTGPSGNIIITSERHFQLRQYPTASLPSAVGREAQMIYDSTTKKSMTSDNTAWQNHY